MKESPTTSVQRPANWSCPRLGELGSSTARPILTKLTGGSPTLTQERPDLASTAWTSRAADSRRASARGLKTPRIRTPKTKRPMPASGVPSHANVGRPPAPRRAKVKHKDQLTHRSAQLRLKVRRVPGPASPAQQAPDDRPVHCPACAERQVPQRPAESPSRKRWQPSRVPAVPGQQPAHRRGPVRAGRPGPLRWAFWAVVQIRLDLAVG